MLFMAKAKKILAVKQSTVQNGVITEFIYISAEEISNLNWFFRLLPPVSV